MGEGPKLPINIALPNAEITREEGETEEHSQTDQEMGDVTILDNQETVKIPEEAQNYLNKLKLAMKESHSKAALNRNAAMDKHKLLYDRKIKKFSYIIGDYVLCDHPRLKKGVARGLAKKYYGPFVVKNKRENGVDYLIQRVGKKRGKTYNFILF